MNTTLHHDNHAVALGMWPRDEVPSHAFAVLKVTYDVSTGTARQVRAEALRIDPADRDPSHALAPGNEYALFKPKTDVIVLGCAFPSRPTQTARVRVRAGNAHHTIDVYGRRVAAWDPTSGARFSEPELFERMTMVAGHAYGGWDPRVPVPEPTGLGDVLVQAVDHPGVYPRNPQGKGYVVVAEPVENIELPNLEFPEDRLTPARFVVGDPTTWWLQPRPAFLGWSFANHFSRLVALQAEPWFPAPTDEQLPEVRAGELPRGYRTSPEWTDCTCVHRLFQEAPPGLQVDNLKHGENVVVSGMRRDGKAVAFTIPAPPRTALYLDSQVLTDRVRLSTLVVRPDEHIVNAIWVASAEPTGRIFVPGIHTKIPLAIRIDDSWVAYQPPTPTHARLRAAQTALDPAP